MIHRRRGVPVHDKQPGSRVCSAPLPAALRPGHEPANSDDDPVPADIDEFRRALTRKILTLVGMPRRCREPLCRRSHRCAGADIRCLRDFPTPPLSPERQARMLAAFARMLAARVAADDDEDDGAQRAPSRRPRVRTV